MEFPCSGSQCSVIDCKQLDFLPFICSHCGMIFCKEHFPTTRHICSKLRDNVINDAKITINSFLCSQNGCEKRSTVEMLCIKCNKNFCLLHRHHDCLEPTELQKSNDLRKWEEPKQQFSEAKLTVDIEVTNKLRKSKNFSTAIKLQLMRLKGKSIGPYSIPTSERIFFLVHFPITNQKDSKGAFVSNKWSIGKVIDSMANSLNISNSNNQLNAKKLRMYNYLTGKIVTNQMDQILSEFLINNSLMNGQDVILEYSEADIIDCSLYK